MLRALVKDGIASIFDKSGVAPLMRRAKNTPVVIGYHRVVEDFSLSSKNSIPAMLISRQMFERHLDWIGRRYQFISLDELASALESGKRYDSPVAAITFDDGYSDVYYNAFPVLKRKGIPAAVFAVAEWIGTSQPLLHDRLYSALSAFFFRGTSPARDAWEFPGSGGMAASETFRLAIDSKDPFAATRALLVSLPQKDLLCFVETLEERSREPKDKNEELLPLSWEMLSEMQHSGIIVGSHTSTHVILTNEGRQKIREEIAGSRRILEAMLRVPILHLAYPDGRFDAGTVQEVVAAGYRCAYTGCEHQDRKYPYLTIPRKVLWENSCLNVHGDFSSEIMSCQMNGLFDFAAVCTQEHGLVGHSRDQVATTFPLESRP